MSTTDLEANNEHQNETLKQLLFYAEPVALNREAHRDLRLQPAPDDYRFAARTNSVPLAAVEFEQACRDYPIVFAGNSDDTLVPSVLVGLRGHENAFVDIGGRWDAESYIPAFVRRYPFVLGEKAQDPDDFTVMIDQAYPGLSSEQGDRLFDESGEAQPLLDHALGFLREFQAQMNATRDFVARLAEHDLFKPQYIRVGPESEAGRVLQGFHVIDETRLNRLTDSVLRQFLGDGYLRLIHAHLLSLGNVERIAARTPDDQTTVQ